MHRPGSSKQKATGSCSRLAIEMSSQSRGSAFDINTACISIVDDDPSMQRMLVSSFRQQNVDTVSASGRQEMLRNLAAEPSVVILDPHLGHEDGLDLLREIRSRSDVPVIITMGHRCDDVDCIGGLELGTDDYVTKLLNPRELLTRVRAVLRRQDMARTASPRGAEHGGFRFDGWQLGRWTRRLTDRQENTVRLTKGEYNLLVAFLEAPRHPLNRECLLQAPRTHDDIFDRSIDVQVAVAAQA
jgi:two-component system, OmpR family, response regulator